MKIAIHSDLHTEFNYNFETNKLEFKFDYLPTNVDCLVLAGDTGNIYSNEALFQQIRESYPNLLVLFVLGNHEFYHNTYAHTVNDYKKLCEKYNIQFLTNDLKNHCIYKDEKHKVMFFGDVFWTDFNLFKQKKQAMENAQKHINDFELIRTYSSKNVNGALLNFLYPPCLTPEDVEKRFKSVVKKLRVFNDLQIEEGYKKVVISHFCPSLKVMDLKKYPNQLSNAYFCSDLESYMSNIDLWIYGHNHHNCDLYLDNEKKTRLVSNQKGYEKERDFVHYQKDFSVEI